MIKQDSVLAETPLADPGPESSLQKQRDVALGLLSANRLFDLCR